MNFFRKLFGTKSPSSIPSPSQRPAPLPPAAPEPEAEPTAAITPAPPLELPPASATFRFQATPPPVEIQTTLLALPSPLWLPFDSPAAELFHAKSDDAPLIAFLGGSADLGPSEAASRPGIAEAASRLARTLPLALAEQIEFGTEALTRPLLSWMVKPAPGFILGGKNWGDAIAARHARSSVPDDPADYLVISHLVCHSDPWSIELRLIRTIDAVCLATASASCSATDPAPAISSLTRDLIPILSNEIAGGQASSFTTSPTDLCPKPSLDYLLALDQLLVVLTAGFGPAAGCLQNEAEIIEGQLRLCLQNSSDVPSRLLFAHTLRALRKIRPDALPAFHRRVDQLQHECPLPEPAHSVIARIFAEAFAV